MVHFNGLKPCPNDIRLDCSSQQASGDPNGPSPARNNDVPESPLPPPPPIIGTDLELVDDDDFIPVDNHHTIDDVAQHTGDTQAQPPTDTRRYPTRQHRPPARLQDYVRS